MRERVEYRLNQATGAAIAEHLSHSDADFVPPLSDRVEIDEYARRIVGNATRFEAWSGDTLVGLVAAYRGDPGNRVAFITNVSVLKARRGQGIANGLLKRCIEDARESGMRRVVLEVARDNVAAVSLYQKIGFVAGEANTPVLTMGLVLGSGIDDESGA